MSYLDLENRFGWVDVGLTENGKLGLKAGDLIKRANIQITYYYSSLQEKIILLKLQETLNEKIL